MREGQLFAETTRLLRHAPFGNDTTGLDEREAVNPL